MARARNIKPGFFRNEELAGLDPITRILFAGLWTVADREGRLEDRPKRIKADVLPYDDGDVDAMLESLTERGFLARYKHGSAQYIQILNFAKHQNPHKNEAPSEIPPHETGESVPESSKHDTSTIQAPEPNSTNRADSLNLVTDSLSSDSGLLESDPTSGADAPQPSGSPPFDLLESLCETLGQDVSVLSKPEKNKQLAVAKRLVDAGMTAQDVSSETRWLKSQSWVTGGIDLFFLEKQLGKWQLEGKPSNARSPNGTVPDAAEASRIAWRRKHGLIPADDTDVIDVKGVAQ